MAVRDTVRATLRRFLCACEKFNVQDHWLRR